MDAALLLVTFRIVALLVGALFVFFGYHLFKIGYFENSGDLAATLGKNRLVLKKTAPGVLFALFGAVVIAIGVWKPLSIPAGDEIPEPVILVIQKVVANNQLSDQERVVLLRWFLTRGLHRGNAIGV